MSRTILFTPQTRNILEVVSQIPYVILKNNNVKQVKVKHFDVDDSKFNKSKVGTSSDLCTTICT